MSRSTGGWTDAYTVDFSGSSGKGCPAAGGVLRLLAAVRGDRRRRQPAPTGALLDTCFRQVEYAGVLQGAKNPAGAQQVVDFLLSPEFQASVPDAMYVYPVDAGGAAARRLAAVRAGGRRARPTLDPATIAANRDAWISSLVGPAGRLRLRHDRHHRSDPAVGAAAGRRPATAGTGGATGGRTARLRGSPESPAGC